MKTSSVRKRVILHIGMHKTGTTAIQKALEGQTVDGVGYAKLGYANHSVPLMTIFQDAPYYYWQRVGIAGPEIVSRKRVFTATLEAELDRSDIDTLLLSGEDIGWLSIPEKSTLITFFEERGHSLDVLCLTRKPVEFAASALQQRIQGGLRNLTEIHPRYADRLKFFLDALGQERLTVVDYASVCEDYGDVVRGFCSIAGLPFLAPEAVQQNRALSSEATRVIFRLNQLTQNFSPLYFQLIERLVPTLTECFPALEEDYRLRLVPAAKLLPASLVEELDFLEREFGIRYSVEQPQPSIEAVESFLRIPSSFALDSFRHHLARSLDIDLSRHDTLDDVLLALLDLFNEGSSDSAP